MDDQPTGADGAVADAGMLRAYLHDRDIHCPRCGYNLRSLTGGRCPECGTRLVLAVREAEPRLGAWIALTVMVCLNAGVGLLIVGLSVKEGRVHHDLVEWPVVAGTIFMMGSLLLAPALLIFRRRFLRLGLAWQRRISFVGVVACGASLLLFILAVQ